MDEWISVEERLPEPGDENVLFYGPDLNICLGLYISAGLKRSMWMEGDFPYRPEEVTHWMPLPDPPQ